MKIRFQSPKKHATHGWFVCTLGAQTKYLHSDMELRDSTHNEHNNYSGYYKTEQEAMDTLVEFITNYL